MLTGLGLRWLQDLVMTPLHACSSPCMQATSRKPATVLVSTCQPPHCAHGLGRAASRQGLALALELSA